MSWCKRFSRKSTCVSESAGARPCFIRGFIFTQRRVIVDLSRDKRLAISDGSMPSPNHVCAKRTSSEDSFFQPVGGIPRGGVLQGGAVRKGAPVRSRAETKAERGVTRGPLSDIRQSRLESSGGQARSLMKRALPMWSIITCTRLTVMLDQPSAGWAGSRSR